MGSRSPFALFSPLLYKATREANPLPALAPATSLPRGPGSLWWKGGQWIRRPAVYSCSLGLGFVARSSGVRRHAPARLTAPSNKVPSRSASNAASLAVVGHGSGSVVAGFGRQDDGGDQTLVFCASVLSSSRRRSLRLRPQISKLVQERGGRHGLHQCRHSGDLLLRCKSEVFAVAFAVLAAGAIILTLNVLLLGGQIIFFQSLSLLGYCLFPLDVGALICLLNDNDILKIVVVAVTLAWSSWAAYPFMSAAVNPRRKALALYPVFLLYVSVGFLIIAIN